MKTRHKKKAETPLSLRKKVLLLSVAIHILLVPRGIFNGFR